VKIAVDLNLTPDVGRLFDLIGPDRDGVQWVELTERDAQVLSMWFGRVVRYGEPDAVLFGHSVVWIEGAP
jgi:hypothetical protein